MAVYQLPSHKLFFHLRLCLNVDIGAQALEMEPSFLNAIVWMHTELRSGIRGSIPWYWRITIRGLSQYRAWPLRIEWNWRIYFLLKFGGQPRPRRGGQREEVVTRPSPSCKLLPRAQAPSPPRLCHSHCSLALSLPCPTTPPLRDPSQEPQHHLSPSPTIHAESLPRLPPLHPVKFTIRHIEYLDTCMEY